MPGIDAIIQESTSSERTTSTFRLDERLLFGCCYCFTLLKISFSLNTIVTETGARHYSLNLLTVNGTFFSLFVRNASLITKYLRMKFTPHQRNVKRNNKRILFGAYTQDVLEISWHNLFEQTRFVLQIHACTHMKRVSCVFLRLFLSLHINRN